jgi:hypothetical protein
LWVVAAIIHAIIGLLALGYAQNYYFHLRMLKSLQAGEGLLIDCRPPQEQRSLDGKGRWLVMEEQGACATTIDVNKP